MQFLSIFLKQQSLIKWRIKKNKNKKEKKLQTFIILTTYF